MNFFPLHNMVHVIILRLLTERKQFRHMTDGALIYVQNAAQMGLAKYIYIRFKNINFDLNYFYNKVISKHGNLKMSRKRTRIIYLCLYFYKNQFSRNRFGYK